MQLYWATKIIVFLLFKFHFLIQNLYRKPLNLTFFLLSEVEKGIDIHTFQKGLSEAFSSAHSELIKRMFYSAGNSSDFYNKSILLKGETEI